MSDVTVETTDATPKEEVVEVSDSEAESDGAEVWAAVEGVRTAPGDWSKEDITYFGHADWGDKILKDEDGGGDWGCELINCWLKVDPSVTSASDFVTMVRNDALNGKMTVEDIFNKYVCGGY